MFTSIVSVCFSISSVMTCSRSKLSSVLIRSEAEKSIPEHTAVKNSVSMIYTHIYSIYLSFLLAINKYSLSFLKGWTAVGQSSVTETPMMDSAGFALGTCFTTGTGHMIAQALVGFLSPFLPDVPGSAPNHILNLHTHICIYTYIYIDCICMQWYSHTGTHYIIHYLIT